MNHRLDGTVRARTPQETWTALEPQLGRLGITRVARLTGLDYLGIPVWTAVRPNARTLVTSQGKGADDTLARISAVLESAELWLAEQPLTIAERNPHRRAGVPYPLEALAVNLRHDGLDRLVLDWAAGASLVSGHRALVPADLVRRQPDPDGRAPAVFHVTSNGLAAGNTPDEATLHGLFEVIERDVLQRDHLAGGAHRTLINPATVNDPYCQQLIRRFLDARLWLEIALVDSPYGIPVCAAYIWCEDYPVIFGGSGCHRDPHIALSRALTEAAQSRLTCIAGTRDDLDSHETAFAAPLRRPEPAWPHTGDWAKLTARYRPGAQDFSSEVTVIAVIVAAVSSYEPIAVPLPGLPHFAGVKVIAPGLTMRETRSVPRPLIGGRHG
ncbi:YcaO-like family protein [Streptomyces sp. NPDC057638]|uniref:YcaO-like family protein n=1 Tax=Streptomyces sp. NPDC057638 TaxID=3346190 RepID=UPI00369EBB3E